MCWRTRGEEAERLAHKHIGTEHLLLGLLREEKCFAAQILVERGVGLSQVREALARQPHEAAQAQKQLSVHDELSSYISDLVDHTQPLIGREKELDRLIEVLSRFNGKNPVLVGEPGVGKENHRRSIGSAHCGWQYSPITRGKGHSRPRSTSSSGTRKRWFVARETGSCPGRGGRRWKNLLFEPDA